MKRSNDEFPIAVHPGEVLQEMLDDLGVSQSKLARHVKVDPSKINEICRGRRGISAEMALILSRALGTSVAVWMNLQKAWELSQADRSVVARVRPLSRVA
jgi:addiction module HigA family antidote